MSDNNVTPIRPDVTLARLMQRFLIATDKLDIALGHWPRPAEICTDDVGAVMITRDVAREMNRLYLALADWAGKRQLIAEGPYVASFEEIEDTEDEEAEEPEAQS